VSVPGAGFAARISLGTPARLGCDDNGQFSAFAEADARARPHPAFPHVAAPAARMIDP